MPHRPAVASGGGSLSREVSCLQRQPFDTRRRDGSEPALLSRAGDRPAHDAAAKFRITGGSNKADTWTHGRPTRSGTKKSRTWSRAEGRAPRLAPSLPFGFLRHAPAIAGSRAFSMSTAHSKSAAAAGSRPPRPATLRPNRLLGHERGPGEQRPRSLPILPLRRDGFENRLGKFSTAPAPRI